MNSGFKRKKAKEALSIKTRHIQSLRNSLKEYDREAEHSFFFKDELDELVLNKQDSILIAEVGQPSALIKNMNQTTLYYPQVEV